VSQACPIEGTLKSMSKPKGRRKPLHSEITSLRRPAKTAQAVLTPADDSTEERVAANTGTADGSAADELADAIGAAPGDDENRLQSFERRRRRRDGPTG
jgi:hypothetical protein